MDLNDDCWILVFSLLDLEDQCSAALACERFYFLLSSLWKLKYLKFSVYDDILDTTDQLNILMKSICHTVETLNLGTLTYEEWDIIKLYTYPNLKGLSLLQPEAICDDSVLEMTKVFPNLEGFSPNSTDISGKHIWNWRKLAHLYFHRSEKVNFNVVEKILEDVHLKSLGLGVFSKKGNLAWTSKEAFKKFCDLERLSLSSNELVLLLNISRFSNLKVLNFLDIANENLLVKVLKEIAEQKYNDVIELHVQVHFPLNKLFVKSYENLQKISFHWRNNSGFHDVLKCAPSLCEVIIMACEDLVEEDIYIWLKSNKIELLSVEKCKLKFSVLQLNVNDVIRDRTKLLHFNFYENEFGLSKVTLNVQGISELLKISCDEIYPDWYCSNRIQFR